MEHISVLLAEAINFLSPQANQNFIDATLGGGGHAYEILKRTGPHGHLLGFDKDESAILRAKDKLKEFGARFQVVNSSYSELAEVADKIKPVAGIIFDLGFNSWQLQDGERGFSWQQPGALDLRYDTKIGQPAYELLNTLSVDELTQIFKDYGEEPQAKKIAKAIVEQRISQKFYTTADLLTIISRVKSSGKRSLPPATLVWQALRIVVNHELEELAETLPKALSLLASGGRIVVISFHSGEDRIAKDFFKIESRDCLCPPQFPKCICGHKASLKIITPKPITPESEELINNPRSRSAKMRVAERI
ncbi:MAG: 16S rRNA (cytosine(1402)-N(4))-methyltransferase RsmH [Patescibacteria group bacterium]